jgi:hypothetical protein
MGLDYVPDESRHGRPEPSLPVIQNWQPVRITKPIKKVIGHLCSRSGGIESFDSGDRSLGIWPDQDTATDAILRAEAALAHRPLARQLPPEPAYPDLPDAWADAA